MAKIRSHYERKQAALRYMKAHGVEKARPLFDYVTEAYLEFYLVEDIYALCCERFEDLSERNVKAKGDRHSSDSLLKQFKYMTIILKKLIDELGDLLVAGKHEAVQKAIKESALMRNAMKVSTMDKLVSMIEDLTKVIDAETIKAGLALTKYNKVYAEAIDNMKNSEKVYDIIPDEKTNKMFDEIYDAVNEDKASSSLYTEDDIKKIKEIEINEKNKNKNNLN